jgi:hypothetical protein
LPTFSASTNDEQGDIAKVSAVSLDDAMIDSPANQSRNGHLETERGQQSGIHDDDT